VIDYLATRASEAVSIDDLATSTGVMHSDVVNTLNELGFLKEVGGEVVIVVNPAAVAEHRARAERAKLSRPEGLELDEGRLRWTPHAERPMLL
jgi:hypothetical protein